MLKLKFLELNVHFKAIKKTINIIVDKSNSSMLTDCETTKMPFFIPAEAELYRYI